mmetsp:Transcript_7304/g.22358  ORF Transcript_7304/g.22358 Transcript_7304/m.22358 type:complete len:103 (-) Transcript_7304:102-410(-)
MGNACSALGSGRGCPPLESTPTNSTSPGWVQESASATTSSSMRLRVQRCSAIKLSRTESSQSTGTEQNVSTKKKSEQGIDVTTGLAHIVNEEVVDNTLDQEG